MYVRTYVRTYVRMYVCMYVHLSWITQDVPISYTEKDDLVYVFRGVVDSRETEMMQRVPEQRVPRVPS